MARRGIKSRLSKVFGMQHTVDPAKIKPVTFDGNDGTQWYRYQPEQEFASGWYMLTVEPDQQTLGHNCMLKTANRQVHSLLLGSKSESKRVVRFSQSTHELQFAIESIADTGVTFRVTLTRLSERFAVSRMVKKMIYAGGNQRNAGAESRHDVDASDVDDLYLQYQQLVERRHHSIDYKSWSEQRRSVTVEHRKAAVKRVETAVNLPSISIVLTHADCRTDALKKALEKTPHCLRERLSLLSRIDRVDSGRDFEWPFNRQFFADDSIDCPRFKKLVGALESDYVLMVGAGVELDGYALVQFAASMLENPDSDVLYCDHDDISVTDKLVNPVFKPQWNAELLLAGNYVGRCFAVKNTTLRQRGGLSPSFDTSMEYELLLRISRETAADPDHHLSCSRISQVLYRQHRQQREPLSYLSTGARDVPILHQHIEAIGWQATVETGLIPGTLNVKRSLPERHPSVDIIIPTRDHVDLLDCCISSILNATEYNNYRITIVDNNSEEAETKRYFKHICEDSRVRVLPFKGEFNYSAINNHAVGKTQGDVVVLLNNDTEVKGGRWLHALVSQAIMPGTGCVGAKLYYGNGLIQHAGVIIGLKGVAGHSHRFYPGEADGYCGRLKLVQSVSAVTAACLAVKRSVYTQVGGLDEVNLKVAYNDVDFCLRVQEAGYSNVWTPYAELYHHESVSRGADDTGPKARRFKREYQYMLDRWSTDSIEDPAYNPNLSTDQEDFGLAA